MVADLGAKVILGVQPPLTALAATLPGLSMVLADGDALPDFDLYCPLLSVPLAFETDIATMPSKVPYLWPQADRLAAWRPRLPDNGRLRVGLCWAGNPVHLNDRNRSMRLDHLSRCAGGARPRFHQRAERSQRRGCRGAQRSTVWFSSASEFADFADTAAAVARCSTSW